MRFATAACMQKYGNVSFATVACAKCMRYGGRGGGPIPWGGGGWQHGTRHHIYIYIYNSAFIQLNCFIPERGWKRPGGEKTGVVKGSPSKNKKTTIKTLGGRYFSLAARTWKKYNIHESP